MKQLKTRQNICNNSFQDLRNRATDSAVWDTGNKWGELIIASAYCFGAASGGDTWRTVSLSSVDGVGGLRRPLWLEFTGQEIGDRCRERERTNTRDLQKVLESLAESWPVCACEQTVWGCYPYSEVRVKGTVLRAPAELGIVPVHQNQGVEPRIHGALSQYRDKMSLRLNAALIQINKY